MAKIGVCNNRPTTPTTTSGTPADNPANQRPGEAARAGRTPQSPAAPPPGAGPPFIVPLREQGVEPHPGPDPPTPPTTNAGLARARPDSAQADRPTAARTSGTPADNPANQRPGEAARAVRAPRSPAAPPPEAGPPFVVPLREKGVEPHPGPDPPAPPTANASNAHARSDAAQTDQTATHDTERHLRTFVNTYAPPDWAAYISLTVDVRAILLRALRSADGLALLHPHSQERRRQAQEWRHVLGRALNAWDTAHTTAAAHTAQADLAAYPVLPPLADPLALALQQDHNTAMPAAQAILLQLDPAGPAPAPTGTPRPYVLTDPPTHPRITYIAPAEISERAYHECIRVQTRQLMLRSWRAARALSCTH
eukprot:4468168-Pleurochrysis_carterae.AAC.1